MTADAALADLHAAADPARAAVLLRFFKTGPGEYGEGDRFIGLTVPQLRAIAKVHAGLAPDALRRLLDDDVHEARMLALLVMVNRYGKAGADERAELVDLYLEKLDRVNNWDLVDASAPGLLGRHLLGGAAGGDLTVLDDLAASPVLWARRVAVVATQEFIRRGVIAPTFVLCERLLGDRHDLMHKACGWMLREAGKRDGPALEAWLERHAHRLPRTMLRYAIERMTPERRRWFMDLKAAVPA